MLYILHYIKAAPNRKQKLPRRCLTSPARCAKAVSLLADEAKKITSGAVIATRTARACIGIIKANPIYKPLKKSPMPVKVPFDAVFRYDGSHQRAISYLL